MAAVVSLSLVKQYNRLVKISDSPCAIYKFKDGIHITARDGALPRSD